MFSRETRVLVILNRDLVDRARVLAGRATTSMRLPVSLQIILRALIEEGLRRPTDPGLLANASSGGDGSSDPPRGAPSPDRGRGCARGGGPTASWI